MSIAFPGYVPDVHAADALDPAWGNAIRDRGLQIFDVAANRDAAIVTPQVGQTGVLTTLSTAGLYTYAGATDGWRAPWNLPWGAVALTLLTSLSQAVTSTTGIDVTGSSTSFTAVANRLYRATAQIPSVQQSGSASAPTRIEITDTSNNNLADVFLQNLTVSGSGSRGSAGGEVILAGLAAGAFLVKLRALVSAGTATLTGSTSSQAFVLVEDIGPNGAPS